MNTARAGVGRAAVEESGSQTAKEPARRLARLLSLAVVGLALCLGLTKVANFDIPLHLATGKTILTNGPPRTNIFSAIHHDRPMVDDKWLFQVAVHAVHRAGGLAGLSVFKGALVLTLALVLLRSAMSRPGAGALSALLVAVALVAAHPRFMIRPDLVSLLFVAAILHLVTGRGVLGRRRLAGVVGLQILWVNTHGYFILGPMLVGLVAIGRWLDERRGLEESGSGRRLLGTGVVMLAVSLANPYGLDGALFPMATLLDLWRHADLYRSGISEFRPTLSALPRLPYDLLLHRVLLVGFVVGLLARGRRWRLAALLPACLLVAISLSLRRNVAPFTVGVGVLAAPGLARLDGMLASRARRWGPFVATGVALFLLAVAAVRGARGRLVPGEQSPRTFGIGLASAIYPEAEVDFIERELQGKRPWNPFDYGAYLTWRLWPRVAAMIDGNTSGYPAAFLAQTVEQAAGRVDLARIREQRGVDYFLVRPFDGICRRLFADPHYVAVFAGLHGVVFVPRETGFEKLIAKHDIGPELRRGELPPALADLVADPHARRRNLLNTAHGLARAGFEDVAGKIVTRVLERDPSSVGAHHLDGWLAARAGDAPRALAAYGRALDVDPRAADVLSDRGWLLMEIGETDRALDDLRRSVALFDEDAQTWWRLSRVRHYQGDETEARRALERCLEIDPGHVEALIALAGLLHRKGGGAGAARALELLRRALEAMPEGADRQAVRAALDEIERG